MKKLYPDKNYLFIIDEIDGCKKYQKFNKSFYKQLSKTRFKIKFFRNKGVLQ